ncbi:MAG: hypothetical protein ACP5RX_02450 [Minisyncoccia bacterium]
MDNSEVNLIQERFLMKKEQLAREGLPIPEDKELMHETIGEKIEESLNNYPPVPEPQLPISPVVPITPPRPLTEEEEAEQKVNDLVEIALQQSIDKAVVMALKTSNAYLIDKLHDTLADKYYEQLKSQKLI